MGKKSIQWHKSCLASMQISAKNINLQLQELIGRSARFNEQISIYTTQIEEAEKRKLDGFDSERFLLSGKKDKE